MAFFTLNGFKLILEFINSKIPDKNVAAHFDISVTPSLQPITGLKTPGYYATRRVMAQRRALRPPGIAPDPTSSPGSFGRTRRVRNWLLIRKMLGTAKVNVTQLQTPAGPEEGGGGAKRP